MGFTNGTRTRIVNGTLFFATGNGPAVISGLWKSDGTAAGTVLLKGGTIPFNLTNVNGTVFFTASDPATGNELWKSDGTVAGTVLVKDIVPGPDSSLLTGLTNANGTLFFTAFDPATGTELWKSDGTAAGTVMVR